MLALISSSARSLRAQWLVDPATKLRSLQQIRHHSVEASPFKFCVVGSGPAGFYTVDRLYKAFGDKCQVDIVEQLQAPFGLVRSGVAPDHPETKNVINHFTQLAADARCSFLGNVTVGRDVSLVELRSRYDAVVLAYGAESDKRLGVPGEDLPGVLSAREFVWWYNGHPHVPADAVDLKSVKSVVICGLGNVAIDCARILLSPPERLKHTDIAAHALAGLESSAIEHVHLVARRGPVQMACTPKELREILAIAGPNLNFDQDLLVPSPAEQEEMAQVRIKRRLHEILSKAAAQANPRKGDRQLHLHYWQSPAEFTGSMSDGLQALKLAATRAPDAVQHSSVVGANMGSTLPAQLALKSIGYRSVPMNGVAFDDGRGVIPNQDGRVMTDGGEHDSRLYVCGWLRRGPSGIIGTNLADAQVVVNAIAQDLQGSEPKQTEPSDVSLEQSLRERGVNVVSFTDWLQKDAAEVAQGSINGKPREKYVHSGM